MDQVWVGRGGQRFGPYSPARILVAERQRKLVTGDSLWWSGLDRPLPLESGLAAIKSSLGRPPTAPVTTPTPPTPLPPRAVPAAHAPSASAALGRGNDIPELTQVESALGARSLRELDYADFRPRFAAAALDAALLTTSVALVIAITAIVFGVNALLRTGVVLPVLLLAAGWLYFALQESGPHHATFGKRWLHMKVLHAYTREPISFWRASARSAGYLASAAVLMSGFVLQRFTLHRQSLHDMLARTVVVSTAPVLPRRLQAGYACAAWVAALILVAVGAYRSAVSKASSPTLVPAAQGQVRSVSPASPGARKSPSPSVPKRPVIPDFDRTK